MSTAALQLIISFCTITGTNSPASYVQEKQIMCVKQVIQCHKDNPKLDLPDCILKFKL